MSVAVETKVCTGPAHGNATRLPLDADHWYYHRSGPRTGLPLARCRLCSNWEKLVEKGSPQGLVPIAKVYPLAAELVDRCGSTYAVWRAHGITESAIRAIVARSYAGVQRRMVRQLLLALAEQRKIDRRNGSSPRFLAAKQEQAKRFDALDRAHGCG